MSDGFTNGPPEVGPEPLSDDFLATAFVDEHGDKYRWTHGMDWMVDAGAHWDHDNTLTRFNAARQTCRRASKKAVKAELKRKVSSAAAVASTLKLAQSDPRVSLPVSAWNAEPLLLNTPGGVVDLRSASIRPRKPDDYFTQIAGATPDFDCPTPVFHKFLLEVFCRDEALIDYVQRVLGYCLTGLHHIHDLYFFFGSGANGKSTLVDLVRHLMGGYATALPADELMASRDSKHKTGIASLQGKRCAVSSELDRGQWWNESLMKELTGDATISARRMRQDFYEFLLTHKHIVTGNHLPRLRGGDPALARRIKLITFNATFGPDKRDAGLPEKLRAEGPGILAWMVRGAWAMLEHGMQEPESVRMAVSEYMHEHDDLALWIDEQCTRSVGVTCMSNSLYQNYAAWKRLRGEDPVSLTEWGKSMKQVPGITAARSGAGIRYQGLTLGSAGALRTA